MSLLPLHSPLTNILFNLLYGVFCVTLPGPHTTFDLEMTLTISSIWPWIKKLPKFIMYWEQFKFSKELIFSKYVLNIFKKVTFSRNVFQNLSQTICQMFPQKVNFMLMLQSHCRRYCKVRSGPKSTIKWRDCRRIQKPGLNASYNCIKTDRHVYVPVYIRIRAIKTDWGSSISRDITGKSPLLVYTTE